MIRIIGAFLILIGGGYFGFSMVLDHRRLEKDLSDFNRIIEFMECQLEFQQTPLPELCSQAGSIIAGRMSEYFFQLSQSLSTQQYQDASACVTALLETSKFDSCVNDCIAEIGCTLGAFDLPGQLHGLRSVRKKCQSHLLELNLNKENRLRSYQTLGLCAGAALAIILI